MTCATTTALTTTLFGMLVVACTPGPGESPANRPEPSAGPSRPASKETPGVSTDLQSVVIAALADAARRAGPDADAPRLVHAERVTWPDGSLGCPMPGRMYTMALVPGFRIRIQSGGAELDYHAAERGSPFLCPAERATEPVPDPRIR
jgi:hypothetical protein